MNGRYGLVLVLFGILVAIGRAIDINVLRDLPQPWFLVIVLLALFGLAWTGTAIIIRGIVLALR